MGNERYEFGHHYILLDNKLDQHIHAFNNPHKVTKAQVGLGNVDDVSTEEIYETVETYVNEGFGNHLDLKQNQLTGEYTISLISKTGEILGNPIIINTDNEYAITDIYLDVEKENLVFERYNADPTICSISPIFDELRNLNVKINAENNRAKEAEDELSNKISAEEVRATDAEEELQRNINAETACREEDVNNAREEFKAADEEIRSELEIERSKINEEISRAKEEESRIESKLETEIERAKAAEKALSDNKLNDVLMNDESLVNEEKVAVIPVVTEMLHTGDERGNKVIPTNEAVKLELNKKVEYVGEQTIDANGLYHHFTPTGFQVNDGTPTVMTEQRKNGFYATGAKDWGVVYGYKYIDRITPTETYHLEVPQENGKLTTKEYVDSKFVDINIENGTGKDSLIQKGDTQEFTVNNPNATNNGETVLVESSGVKSTAVFNGSARATGSRAFAANSKTQAIGDRSAAFGNQTVAEGVNSFAAGNQTTTKGAAAFASGAETFAKGDASFTAGYNTVAAEFGSAAFGNHTSANGLTSFVIGNDNYANGKQSFAGGNNSVASYENDFVFGESLENNYENQAVFGRFNDASDWSNPRPLFIIGNGVDNEHRSNAFKVYADGHAEVQTMGTSNNAVVIKEYVDTETARATEAELKNARAISDEVNSRTLSVARLDSELAKKADLGEDGKVLDEQLPDWTNDVIQYKKEQTGSDDVVKQNALALNIGEILYCNSAASSAPTYAKKLVQNVDGTEAGLKVIQPVTGKVYINDSSKKLMAWTGSNLVEYSQMVLNTARGTGDTNSAYRATFGVQNYNDIVKLQKLFEAGEGENSVQQKQSSKEFEFDNPNYAPSIEVKFGAFGKDSVVLNGNSMANGALSTAEGRSTLAIGDRSHSEGTKTVAANNNAHAEGLQSVASGDHSHAEGCLTFAKGLASHAEGNKTYAALGQAHAEGLETQATNYQAHAEGTKTIASGVNAHAEGDSTKAVGGNSHSEGVKTNASGDLSHVEGYGTYTGIKPQEGGSSGSGTSTPTTPEQDGYDLVENSGFASHAEGVNNSAIGNYSHAEGYGTKALFGGSHAEGNKTITSRVFQHVCGVYNKENSDALFVIGNGENETTRTNALEVYKDGHAELQTQGISNNSVVIKGYIEQYLTQNYTTNLRTGVGAKSVVSYGGNPNATGNFALALGYSNNAAGEASAALGYKTKTTNRGQLSVGVNNKNDAGALFDVGNGDVSGTSSSAFTVYQDGLVVIPNGAKGIKIGNTVLTEEKLNKLIALLDTMEAE